MARNLYPVVLLLSVACGGSVARPQFVSTRPVPETIDCLATALDSAGYRISRTDRRRGQLDARREGAEPTSRTDLREYKRGDRLVIDAALDKKTYTVTPESYRDLRSQTGATTEMGAPTEDGVKDAAFFAARCTG